MSTSNWPEYLGGSWMGKSSITQAEYVLTRIKDAGGMTTGEVHQVIMDWQYGPDVIKYSSVKHRGKNCTVFYGWNGYVNNYCIKNDENKWIVLEEIKPGPNGRWREASPNSKARMINDARRHERYKRNWLKDQIKWWPNYSREQKDYWLNSKHPTMQEYVQLLREAGLK